MKLTSPKYSPSTGRSIVIHSPAKGFWGIDPTTEFQQQHQLPNGARVGLIKKDMGKREVRRRGWDENNTRYGHSLSLTRRFLSAHGFGDVLAHFNTLDPDFSDTTPCSGVGYYGTKHGFTVMESIAFFLFHGFELHLDAGFLRELPDDFREEIEDLHFRLSRSLAGGAHERTPLAGVEAGLLAAGAL